MSARQTERFEAHLLDCADCWQEVTLARSGRTIAESLRELAPQSLRERIRTATISEGRSPHRYQLGRLTATAVSLALVVSAGAALLRMGTNGRSPARQPESVAQAIIDFQNARIPAERPVERAAPDLSELGFAVTGAGSGELGKLKVDGFSYLDNRAPASPLPEQLAVP